MDGGRESQQQTHIFHGLDTLLARNHYFVSPPPDSRGGLFHLCPHYLHSLLRRLRNLAPHLCSHGVHTTKPSEVSIKHMYVARTCKSYPPGAVSTAYGHVRRLPQKPRIIRENNNVGSR